MIKSRMRRGAQLGMLAAVALGMGSFGAAGASAGAMWNEIPFSTYVPASVSGTLQLTHPADGSVSCPVLTAAAAWPGYITPVAVNGSPGGSGNFLGMSRQTCSNGKQFEVSVLLSLSGTTGSWTAFLPPPPGGGPELSPFTVAGVNSKWYQTNATVPVTNGAGGVPTKLTFNNIRLGYQNLPTMGLSATGTLNVNTPGGGTLTVGLR